MLTEETLSDIIVTAIKAALAPLRERIAVLETQTKMLEGRALSPEYKGVFQAGETYERGNMVTRSGSLWLALDKTALVPGANPTAWRLVVKSGDAR